MTENKQPAEMLLETLASIAAISDVEYESEDFRKLLEMVNKEATEAIQTYCQQPDGQAKGMRWERR